MVNCEAVKPRFHYADFPETSPWHVSRTCHGKSRTWTVKRECHEDVSGFETIATRREKSRDKSATSPLRRSNGIWERTRHDTTNVYIRSQYMAETEKLSLTSSNLIDAVHNDEVLWDSMTSSSEGEKERAWMRIADMLGMFANSRRNADETRTWRCEFPQNLFTDNVRYVCWKSRTCHGEWWWSRGRHRKSA